MPILRLLQLHPKNSRLVGRRTVDGQVSTEYRLTYSAQELRRPFPSGATDGVLGLLAQLAEPVEQQFPVDIWLDGEGRLVQLTASATLEKEPALPSPAQAALANLLPTTVRVKLDLRDFGAPIKLQVPPAPEVARVPLARLQAGLL